MSKRFTLKAIAACALMATALGTTGLAQGGGHQRAGGNGFQGESLAHGMSPLGG